MKLLRLLLTLAAVGVLGGVAYVGQATEPAGAKMANAAEKFLQSLSDEQKTKATFAFDDKERFAWHFVPLQDSAKKTTRKGLPLEEMADGQKDAAKALLRAGTSAGGYTKATTIMSLEAILHDLEKGGAMVRNPGWYFFTVFGPPSKTAPWGWRVEGHHLSLNFTLDGGKVVSATPAFFGANPATYIAGPKKGTKVLPEAEDLAKELFETLDDGQKKVALQKEQFEEIQGGTKAPRVGEPRGLPAAKMTDKQRDLLAKLLQSYADRMPGDVAQHEMEQVKGGGLDKVHFAYAGGPGPGQPHSYRIQGPSFVVEFLDVQADSARNPANHIHSAWRSLKGDFGLAEK
jgi:hypothetical protein